MLRDSDCQGAFRKLKMVATWKMCSETKFELIASPHGE